MESESTEDMFESPSAEEHGSGFEDPPPSGGMFAVKEHICKDKTTFIMYCSRVFQIVAALGYLLPIIL